MGRFVYVNEHNCMGEVVSEQLHGAYVRYIIGGFEVEEFLTKDDYEELDFFVEDDE